jgi:hypothetical protein
VTVKVPEQVPAASTEYPVRSMVPPETLFVPATAGELEAIGPETFTVPVGVRLMPVSVEELPTAMIGYGGNELGRSVTRGVTT